MYFRDKGMVVGAMDVQTVSGNISLDDVQCVGHEASIADCPHRRWGDHNCHHSEDVYLSCGQSPVQFGKSRIPLR